MSAFTGLKALVVEDEGAVALLIEDMLVEMGCEIVASVARFAEARSVAETAVFDFAVLDINLAGISALSIAHMLRERRIPFILSTGYGASGIPPELTGNPVLGKPFTRAQFRQAIAAALSGQRT